MKGIARVLVHADPTAFGETIGKVVPDDVVGAYTTDDNTLHFISSRLPDVASAKRIFRHEGFGHLAIEKSPDFAKALEMVGNLRDLLNKRVCEPLLHIELRYADANETTLCKEVIAHMAEEGLTSAIVDRAKEGVQGLLKCTGDDAGAVEAELRRMIVLTARGLPKDAL
jgi:hypothetical protein